MYLGYIKRNQTVSFLGWVYWEYDEPAGCKYDSNWFKYLGSAHRRRFLRLFGFEFEWTYTRRWL